MESIILSGNSLETIGVGSFQACTALTSIILPESLLDIRPYAFNGCSALTSLLIPSLVSTIGGYVFIGSGITDNILVDINNLHYEIENKVLYKIENNVQTELVLYLSSKTETSYTIPSSVEKILEGAFYNTTMLIDVTIPSSVLTIGANQVFVSTIELKYLNIYKQVGETGVSKRWTYIGDKIYDYTEEIRDAITKTRLELLSEKKWALIDPGNVQSAFALILLREEPELVLNGSIEFNPGNARINHKEGQVLSSGTGSTMVSTSDATFVEE